MSRGRYLVAGVTHVDLAWMKDRHEMAELLDIFVVRLLDAMENNPSFKYVLEQAIHFRGLAERRPDLVQRVKRLVLAGRLEVVGGMASTMETNIPCGESFVRNLLLGTAWFRESFGVQVTTGWLWDTFGINAQVPQILGQFGIRRLVGSRFGCVGRPDVFKARGLDGSEILVVGCDSFAPSCRPGHLFCGFIRGWKDADLLFETAREAKGPGPYIVMLSVENEMPLSLRAVHHVETGNLAEPGQWSFATPRDCFDALEAAGRDWPVENGDLNPEFTGTFSNRVAIKLRNRRTETLLLEAEKWSAIAGLKAWDDEAESPWWRMAFNQYHDVLTGSHPTLIFNDVLAGFDAIDLQAGRLLDRSFKALAGNPVAGETGGPVIVAFNGLPWTRRDLVSLPLADVPGGVGRITCQGREVPCEVHGGQALFLAEVPATGCRSFAVEGGTVRPGRPARARLGLIENEYIRLECDDSVGIRRLVWKGTGAVLVENAGDFLVVQPDNGHLQIEEPAGAEVPARNGRMELRRHEPSAVGQRLDLAGGFPPMPWAGEGSLLEWEAGFLLLEGKPRLDMSLRIRWKGEGSRIRLKLATTLGTSTGIYEIPFGVVRREPYGTRATGRGEWPAQRFVAIEDGKHGLALVNTGTPGVEVNGGCIWTTILRAPRTEYGIMVPDDTSSQHGDHLFRFAIVPYAGTWGEAGVARTAQEVNSPVLTALAGARLPHPADCSFLGLSPGTVVLSAVKPPQDGSDELVVRVYETAGRPCAAELFVRDANRAWISDLTESRHEQTACSDGLIRLEMKPFEIRTLRIDRR